MKRNLMITFALLWVACGTTDETNSGICGKVTDSNGLPVANTSLKIFRDSAVVPCGELSTASDGTFLFASLTPGTYGIWAEEGDSMAAHAASIVVPSQELVTRDIRLEISSSLTAYVRLQGGENPNTVSVQTLGTDKTARVGPDGRFTINQLAKGGYTLRLSTSAAGYSTMSKQFTIASGAADTLKDTIVFTLVNPFPTNERLTAITCGNGRFVAVGYNRTIITSTDGSDWSVVSGNGRNLNAVTWGDNLFVAVGDSCGAMTSGDGIHWTPYTLLPVGPCINSQLLCVTYGNGQFVAAGSTDDANTIIFTSVDGIVWKEQPADGSIPLYALAYGNSTFVGVGADRALVSSDGIHWNPFPVETAPTIRLDAVIRGVDQFVAVGGAGLLYTSPDGKTWTKQDVRTDADLVGAVWQDNHFTVIGCKDTNCQDPDSVKIATSSDGVSWTSFLGWTAPPAAANITALSYGTGVYVAVGGNGLVTSSSDGIVWKNRSSVTTEVLNDICRDTGRFIAVGSSGTIISSKNGIQWHLCPSGTTSDLQAIACGVNCFVAVGAAGVMCASADGDDWATVSSPTQDYLTGIAWGNGRYVAVGEKKIILSSSDGRMWNIVSPADDTIRSAVDSRVAYGNYGFIVVNNRGEMFTSADGLTWKSGNAARNGSYRGVAWGADKYVVVGNDDSQPRPAFFFCTSSDGKVWTGRQSIPQAPCLTPVKIGWGADQFVVIDGNRPASNVYSPDGLTWSLLFDPCAYLAFNAFAWDGTRYVFVGNGGAIWTHPPF